MTFSWWTFALQAANFLVLVWLLRRFLFKPVGAMVARRKEEITRGLAEASMEKQKAENLQHELEAQRAGIEAERRKAADDQQAQLALERKKMLEDARAEADELRRQAGARIDEERAAAATELFSHAIELAAGIAERLLRELQLPSIEAPFLKRVLDHLDRLSPAERASLLSHLGANTLVVTTAHPLDTREEAEWRAQLGKRIGDSISINFCTDPALIAGAEITFPHAILRFNWRDSLAAAAQEIHRNEHSG